VQYAPSLADFTIWLTLRSLLSESVPSTSKSLAQRLLTIKLESTMKIAIPEHQGRIAPVFDTCRRILVFAHVADSEEIVAQEDWSVVSRQGRVTRLKELSVDVLLCGAISCGIEDQIHGQGISLVAWLAGEVATILKVYREDRAMNPEYAMPGYARVQAASADEAGGNRGLLRS
jgi:hypothetical protein